MNLQRLLIVLDDSPHSSVALRQGAQLASALRLPVRIIALDSADGPVAQRASAAADGLRSAGQSAEVVARPRRGPELIVEECAAHDLLVFGVETEAPPVLFGRRRLPHMLAASVRRPALIAGEQVRDISRILIGVSASPTSLLAARLGAQIAAAVRATADIVHVAEALPEMYAGLERMEETTREFLDAPTSASHVVHHCASIVERHGVRGETHVVSGNVAEEILRVTGEGGYDLVVVGPPPPRPGVFSLALGDVTAALIRAGDCSVLVASRRPTAQTA